jgi:tRNA(Phe) wybutosine-synthesizing methylase Tyw3
MAGWLFYLFIVMMIVPFGGSAQYNIARNVGFVSCGIRAINHQMIIARSSIRRNYNIVVMDVRRFLSGDIIRPVETEIDSGFVRSGSPALSMRMVVEITMYFNHIRL